MKKLINYILPLIFAFAIMSCGGKKSTEEKVISDLEKIEKEAEKIPQTQAKAKIFNVKQGYVKYKNIAMGMEMTREFWFDDFGALQYEENFMEMMGQKTGGSALVRDGFRYSWSYDATEGTKTKFYTSAYTEFDKVSKEDIDRYKMKNLGFETIAGKKCTKVSVEEPIVATTWTWEGLPMKTVTKISGKDVTMEALEVKEDGIPASKFEVPDGIKFTEM